MRKRHAWILSLIIILAVVVFAACGGGGGGGGNAGSASTLTATVGAGTTTYTEGPINNIGYYDPSFSGDSAPGVGTLITMCSGVSTTCDILINIRTADATPGPYPITGGSSTPTYIVYSDHGQHYYSILSSGTVTLTSVGNVGQPITGSFQAVLELWTVPTSTLAISGTFSVLRDH
jgi:hypothetical protein